MQLLSPGNIVTAALQIYRSHFKLYFRLSLVAHLWLIIPIYGWAKFFAISALISRLVFGELTGKPETIKDAIKLINRRLGSFFLTPVWVTVIVIFSGFLLSLITLALIGIITQVFSSDWLSYYPKNQFASTLLTLIILLVMLAILLGFVVAVLWVYSNFFPVELPLAIEDKMDSFRAIGRSWHLTKGAVFRIQLILTIAFFIFLPIGVLLQIVAELINYFDSYSKREYSTWLNLLTWGLVLLYNVWLLPFFQAIKAVLYYDVRNRREGLDLEIRDR